MNNLNASLQAAHCQGAAFGGLQAIQMQLRPHAEGCHGAER